MRPPKRAVRHPEGRVEVSGFGSHQSRFGLTSWSNWSEVPGPGAYESVFVASPSLSRRGYCNGFASRASTGRGALLDEEDAMVLRYEQRMDNLAVESSTRTRPRRVSRPPGAHSNRRNAVSSRGPSDPFAQSVSSREDYPGPGTYFNVADEPPAPRETSSFSSQSSRTTSLARIT